MELEGNYNTADIKTDELEEACKDQIQEMIDHEAFKGDKNVAIMPDTHFGQGAVIGFTKPFDNNRICPNTIGVDIGCGMTAVNLGKINLDTEHEETLHDIDGQIRHRVPMGFDTHSRSQYHFKNDFPWELCSQKLETFNQNSGFDIDNEYSIQYFKDLVDKVGYKTGRTINSMGTLGGGNHFIELGTDSEDNVWIIVHSGSRGIGHAVAEYWQDKATELRRHDWIQDKAKDLEMPDGQPVFPYVKFNEEDNPQEILEWLQGAKGQTFKKEDMIREDFNGEEIQEAHETLRQLMPDQRDANTDLDYLEGDEAHGYIKDMIFAQTYAQESRRLMSNTAAKAVADAALAVDKVEVEERIESVHNYIDFEDQTIRKGACRAHEDEKLVIPFNMNYGTLICKGKGKGKGMEDWNNSAPHGAGRAMSRTAAKEKYSTEDMKNQTEGVYMSKNPVDETPKAYKDPEIIEQAIGDTAEIIDRVKPFMSLKAE